MTVKVDAKKRVLLPVAKPGDVFEIQLFGEGQFVLTRMEPVSRKSTPVRFEKRNGYTVGVSDRPVSQKAINEVLAEFP